MKYRKLVKLISSRLSEPRPLIQVIVGPRQVGKTTALRAALDGRGLYETADSPTPLSPALVEEWWKRAEKSADPILAIDEIQKIPGWSEVLKRLWDRRTLPLKVVVTGSSALLVEKGLKETLAGRFELIRAEHWNLAEAEEIFGISLEQFIQFGCYPGATAFLENLERWGDYVRDAIVEPALGRDLLQLHPVDQPALLRQIFGVASSLPCQVISLQKLQGQLQGRGTLPTLQHYLQLLSDATLVSGIEKYSPVPFRTKKTSPKLIVHDNGLIRAFRRPVTKPISQEERGHYFENAIGARFVEAGWETWYWKERNWEVDFVVEGPAGELWAVEVKSTNVREKDLEGLRRFCEIYPKFQPCLVSLEDQHEEQKMPGVTCLNPREILSLARRH